LIEAWRDGAIDLVLCPRLLNEVDRVLRRPKLRARVDQAAVDDFLDLLRNHADVVEDPTDAPRIRSEDPDDDYVIALAARERAQIVTGDAHLLKMSDEIPVVAPRTALDVIAS
jgi:putative PIN family toxin of toxin-antitoxin system